MDNNNNPIEPVVNPSDAQMPEIPSVDDISVAEMPELEAVPETVAEAAVEAASEEAAEAAVEAVPEAVDEAVPETAPEAVAEAVPETAPEAVDAAVPEAAPEAVAEAVPEAAPEVTAVPVVEEYPAGSGTPQYTSYVPQSTEKPAAPEVYTAPVAAAPVVPTPVYGSSQQPQAARPVPVYVTGAPAATAGHGKAVASLVIGILSILFSPCCCTGVIPGIIGICLGASARSDGNKEGISTAGIILSVLAVIFSILMCVSCVAMMNSTGNAMQNMPDFSEFYNEMYGEMYGAIRMLFM